MGYCKAYESSRGHSLWWNHQSRLHAGFSFNSHQRQVDDYVESLTEAHSLENVHSPLCVWTCNKYWLHDGSNYISSKCFAMLSVVSHILHGAPLDPVDKGSSGHSVRSTNIRSNLLSPNLKKCMRNSTFWCILGQKVISQNNANNQVVSLHCGIVSKKTLLYIETPTDVAQIRCFMMKQNIESRLHSKYSISKYSTNFKTSFARWTYQFCTRKFQRNLRPSKFWRSTHLNAALWSHEVNSWVARDIAYCSVLLHRLASLQLANMRTIKR